MIYQEKLMTNRDVWGERREGGVKNNAHVVLGNRVEDGAIYQGKATLEEQILKGEWWG